MLMSPGTGGCTGVVAGGAGRFLGNALEGDGAEVGGADREGDCGTRVTEGAGLGEGATDSEVQALTLRASDDTATISRRTRAPGTNYQTSNLN